MTVRKSSRVFFKIASILSFIVLSICLIFTIGILFEISIFEDTFKLVYQEIYELTDAELEKVKFDFVINCLFSALINFYAGRSYLNISKNKSFVLTSKRTMIFFAILQFLFGMFVASIFAIIGIILYKPKTYSQPIIKKQTQPTTSDVKSDKSQLPQEALDFCQANIEELNKLLSENKITKEEYDKAFNNLLSVDYYSSNN